MARAKDKPPKPPSRPELALQLRESGMTWREIAEEMGISEGRAQQLARKAGYVPRVPIAQSQMEPSPMWRGMLRGFPKMVQAERAAAGHTQAEMAKLAGIGLRTYQTIEYGGRGVDRDEPETKWLTVEAICRALGIHTIGQLAAKLERTPPTTVAVVPDQPAQDDPARAIMQAVQALNDGLASLLAARRS